MTSNETAVTYPATIPIFRMFDIAATRDFYLGFLGFKVDWEHRFAPELPLYMQVSRGAIVLHLSQHHGDCTPGGAVRIHWPNLDALKAELDDKDYTFLRPGIERQPWGMRELIVRDPSSNRLVFFEDIARGEPT